MSWGEIFRLWTVSMLFLNGCFWTVMLCVKLAGK